MSVSLGQPSVTCDIATVDCKQLHHVAALAGSCLRQTALVNSKADIATEGKHKRWDLDTTWGFVCGVSEFRFYKCHVQSYCTPQLPKVPLYGLVTVNTERRK